MACGTIAGRMIGLVLGTGALLAGSAVLSAEDASPAAATSQPAAATLQPAEGRDSLTVRYGCRFRGTAIRVIIHRDGKDLELSRDKVSAVVLSPDKVTLTGEDLKELDRAFPPPTRKRALEML